MENRDSAINWIEIPASNYERAARFYNETFAVE
jgi:predicted enzyme related to lactoylglutathione lyase